MSFKQMFLLLGGMFGWLLVGCTSPSTPVPTPVPTPIIDKIVSVPDVELVVNPQITDVTPKQTVSLSVNVSGENLSFKWTVRNGLLSDYDEPSVLYTAPNSPGIDTVTIEVIGAGGSSIESVTFQVIAPETDTPTPETAVSPTGTNTPTSSPTVTATPTATETSTATAIPNLVINSGFEDDYKIGWNSEGNIEIEQSTNSSSGQYALCFTQNATQLYLWVIVDQIVQVEENTQYQYLVKINSEDVTNFHLRLDWYNNDILLEEEQIDSAFNGSTQGWITKGGTTMSPPNANLVKLRMLHGLLDEGQAVLGSVACIDEIVFKSVP